MNLAARRTGRPAVLVLHVTLALLYAWYLLYSTKLFGPALSVDSASYVGAARGIATGAGLVSPICAWQNLPARGAPRLTFFPPLLPLLLGETARFSGGDVLRGARSLDALLGAGTLFIALRVAVPVATLDLRFLSGSALLGSCSSAGAWASPIYGCGASRSSCRSACPP